MTNLDAIKATVAGYPLTDNIFLKVLIDRGVEATDTYAGISMPFELATADLLVRLLTAANITEGGMQVSVTDKSNFIKVASGLYDKYGEVNPLASKIPTVMGISPW